MNCRYKLIFSNFVKIAKNIITAKTSGKNQVDQGETKNKKYKNNQ